MLRNIRYGSLQRCFESQTVKDQSFASLTDGDVETDATNCQYKLSCK